MSNHQCEQMRKLAPMLLEGLIELLLELVELRGECGLKVRIQSEAIGVDVPIARPTNCGWDAHGRAHLPCSIGYRQLGRF
jgi:hypothetical protein